MATEEVYSPRIRLEEEEYTDEEEDEGFPIGFARGTAQTHHEAQRGREEARRPPVDQEVLGAVLKQLMEERRQIVDSTSLRPRLKLKMLESNRKAFVVARGGGIRKTGTSSIAY